MTLPMTREATVWHELKHVMGLDDPSGAFYLFWSGIGGRWLLPMGVVAGWLRHHNCEAPGCIRPGHNRGDGIYCRRHA